MATTVSSATSSALTSSAQATAAANKVNAQKILTSMGAGSGVDTASLAQNLVDAERVPQQNAINAKITKNEARISGYSALSFVMNQLKTSFGAMKVKSDFNTITVANSDPNAFTVTPGAFATKASYDIQVLSVAKPQRTLSKGFDSSSDTLNAGNSFSISLSVAGGAATTIPILAGDATPLGVVNAINSQTPALPVKAQLVNTGITSPAVASKVSMAGISFGSPALATDFSAFSMNVGGTAIDLSPLNLAAGTTSLSSLASQLQTKLRAADGGAQNLTVSVNNGALEITDASGRALSGVSLLRGTTQALPSHITIADVQFGQPAAEGDFTGFSVSIGGQPIDLSPLDLASGTTDLESLASELQSKLREVDLSTNLSVSVDSNGTGLVITDSAGRAVDAGSLSFDANATGVGVGLIAYTQGSPFVSNPTVGAVTTTNGTEAVKAYQIMLTGDVGTTNSFAMTSSFAGLSFGTQLQAASDASIKVDGISYTRSSNTIDNLLSGSTLTLKAPTVGSALVDLSRDTTSTKDKIKALVTAFNDANTIFKEVSDPKSTLDTYGATLVSDSTVRMFSQQMRNMVLGTSSTPATKASAMWQIGVSITQTGELDLDETKLDAALKDNYDDIVKMFTGNKNLFLSTATDPAGIAGDAVRKITTLLGANGPLLNQTDSATKQNTKYKDDLTKLQTRMDSLLKRYTTQFASMQSLVGQTNSMKTSLKSSFDGMMATYTNK